MRLEHCFARVHYSNMNFTSDSYEFSAREEREKGLWLQMAISTMMIPMLMMRILLSLIFMALRFHHDYMNLMSNEL